jgi:hypothetical protein
MCVCVYVHTHIKRMLSHSFQIHTHTHAHTHTNTQTHTHTHTHTYQAHALTLLPWPSRSHSSKPCPIFAPSKSAGVFSREQNQPASAKSAWSKLRPKERATSPGFESAARQTSRWTCVKQILGVVCVDFQVH